MSERANQAYKALAEAQKACDLAEAEDLRRRLVDVAAEFSQRGSPITSISVSIESEYDDEGGYYPSVSAYVEFVNDNDLSEDDYLDEGGEWGQRAWNTLMGNDPESYEGGEITVEKLKEVSF